MKLAPTARIALAKLIRLLASDRDGEVVAAARALGRSLAAAGYDYHAFAQEFVEAPSATPSTAPNGGRARASRCTDPVETEPSWTKMVAECANWPERFSEKEWGLIE